MALRVGFMARRVGFVVRRVGLWRVALGREAILFPFIQNIQIFSVSLGPIKSINLVISNEHVFGVVCEDLNTKKSNPIILLEECPFRVLKLVWCQ